MNKALKTILVIVLIVLGLGIATSLIIQLIPSGRDHTNPPVLQEPQWDSPQTRELVKRACFDCHSNETVWPWYSNIAPVSWLVQHDVEEGRQRLNFSEWGTRRQETDEILEIVQEGQMPLPIYLTMHPDARLNAQEKQALIDGLRATFGSGAGGD